MYEVQDIKRVADEEKKKKNEVAKMGASRTVRLT